MALRVPKSNVAPSVAGDGLFELPDPVFLAVVNTYVAEHENLFGGRWLDRDAGGTFVVAFTDEPAAHRRELSTRTPSTDDFVGYWPPPQITDTRPIGEWDVAWDVVQVEHTELDLVRAIAVQRAAIQDPDLL